MFEFFSKDLYDDTLDEIRRYGEPLLALPQTKHLFIDPAIKDAIRDFVVRQQRQLRGQ